MAGKEVCPNRRCQFRPAWSYLKSIEDRKQALIDDLLLQVKAVNTFDDKQAMMLRNAKSSILGKNYRCGIEFF
jgi:hypothetical protein